MHMRTSATQHNMGNVGAPQCASCLSIKAVTQGALHFILSFVFMKHNIHKSSLQFTQACQCSQSGPTLTVFHYVAIVHVLGAREQL